MRDLYPLIVDLIRSWVVDHVLCCSECVAVVLAVKYRGAFIGPGAGALATLLNREIRAESDWVARMVEYVDLASLKDFKEEFIEALHIPHKKDPFPHLESILPPEILFQK